jgi:O-antigen/teichoic acid export membrane protein
LAGVTTLTVSSYIVAPHTPAFRIRHSAGRHLIAFGRWIFAIAILGVASDLFLKALISTRLGVAPLGLFSLADKLAETPNQLTNEAVGGVALPLYARLRSDAPRLTAALRSHLIALMCFLMPATALLIALAGPLEVRILGPAWAGASPMVVLLATGYLFELIFLAVAPLLTAIGAVPRLFLVDVLQYVVLIAAAITLVGSLGLAAIGIARILASLVVVVAGVWVAPPIFAPIAGPLARAGGVLILLSALSGAVARLLVAAIPGAAGVIVGAAAGAAVFLGASWLTDRPLRIGIRECLGAFFPILAPNPTRIP